MTTDNAQISIRKAQLAFQLIWAKIPRQTNNPLFVLCCWPCCFRCFTSLNLFNFDASPYLHVRVFLTFLSFDVLLGSNLPNVCSIHFHFLDLINSTMGCWLVQFQSFYDQRMPRIFLIHRLTKVWNLLFEVVVSLHVADPYRSTALTLYCICIFCAGSRHTASPDRLMH